MLTGLLKLRSTFTSLWSLVHKQESQKSKHELLEGDENEEKGGVHVAQLLECLEQEFMSGLIQEQEDMGQHGPWGMIVAVTMLAFQCRDDVNQEFLFLRGIILEIMSTRKDTLHNPSAKFRALLRYLVDNKLLDKLFSALALMTDDVDYSAIVRGYYTETIFLSKTFMQLLVKLTLQARSLPIRTNMTGDPFIVNKSKSAIDASGLKEGANMEEIEMKMDPQYQSKIRQRGRSSDMTIGIGDISLGTVFQGTQSDENDKEKEDNSRSNPSSSPPSSSSSSPSQRTHSSPVPMAKAAMEASGASSNEESLIAELELVLADLRMNQENLSSAGAGVLERGLLSAGERYGGALNRSRNSSFNSDIVHDGGGVEHDDQEQVKWVKEQIKAKAWSSGPIPARVSGTPELLRALLESLLQLRTPLMGTENFESFQLVMDIPDRGARVRNVGLLVAQAPSPTFPILSALLRLFDQLVREKEVSLPGACICLCPLLFCTRRGDEAASESSSLFFFRGGSGECYGSYLRHPEVLVQSSRACYIVELLLGHAEEVLSICESNR